MREFFCSNCCKTLYKGFPLFFKYLKNDGDLKFYELLTKVLDVNN
jgi:hypothetical protein